MRCFVALPVPMPIAERLAELAADRRLLFPHARWHSPEDLHVTLQFLGEVGPEQVEAISTELPRALQGMSSMEIEVPTFGVFAGAGVLLAAVAASRELLQLSRAVTEAMRQCGFEPELRPFRPHITLARTRRSLPVEHAQRWSGEIERAVRIPCTDVVLYHSRGAPTDMARRYDPMVAFPLQLPRRERRG